MDMPVTDPGRIALLGDVHMNTTWTVAAIQLAARLGVRAVLQLGDFGYTFDIEFLQNVDDALERTGMHLIFLDGNHEDHDRLGTGRHADGNLNPVTNHIHHAGRGYRWTWNGVRFLAVGGAHSIDRPWRISRGAMWHREEALTAEQIALAVHGGPADVLLSHDCPTGVPIPGLSDAGWDRTELAFAQRHRTLLRKVVDAVQPHRIYHGHYHVGYRTTTDLGYGPVDVTGLDRDRSTMIDFMSLADLHDGHLNSHEIPA